MLLVLYIVFFKRGKTRRGIWFVLTQVLLERSLSKDGKRLKTKDLVSINLYVLIYIFIFIYSTVLHILIRCTVHLLLFCTVTNKCTIISQIITLLHVSTLSCHPQTVYNQYLAKLHQYFKYSCR